MAWLESNTTAAAVGAIILYANWGRTKLRPHLLGPLIELIPLSERVQRFLEFAVFIAFGTYVTVYITHPANQLQAFSAGLGWTGFAASPNARK